MAQVWALMWTVKPGTEHEVGQLAPNTGGTQKFFREAAMRCILSRRHDDPLEAEAEPAAAGTRAGSR